MKYPFDMKTTNKNLVAVGYKFTINSQEYKVINFGAKHGVPCWYCMTLKDNNKKFSISKDELDNKLMHYQDENKHLMYWEKARK